MLSSDRNGYEVRSAMIIAENLTKYYGLKPAVQNVSFRIEKGEIVGLLGPNGAFSPLREKSSWTGSTASPTPSN